MSFFPSPVFVSTTGSYVFYLNHTWVPNFDRIISTTLTSPMSRTSRKFDLSHTYYLNHICVHEGGWVIHGICPSLSGGDEDHFSYPIVLEAGSVCDCTDGWQGQSVLGKFSGNMDKGWQECLVEGHWSWLSLPASVALLQLSCWPCTSWTWSLSYWKSAIWPGLQRYLPSVTPSTLPSLSIQLIDSDLFYMILYQYWLMITFVNEPPFLHCYVFYSILFLWYGLSEPGDEFPCFTEVWTINLSSFVFVFFCLLNQWLNVSQIFEFAFLCFDVQCHSLMKRKSSVHFGLDTLL